MWTVIRAKRREKIMLYVWYVNLDCMYIHTPFSSARSAEKILYCTINLICNISIYIIYTYNYTHLVRAKRGENMKLYYVYHTTSYCIHISLHLFSSAQSAEIKCWEILCTHIITEIKCCEILCTHIITHLLFESAERRDKMLCITYYIPAINTCSVS